MASKHRSQPDFLQHACIATRMIDKRRQLFDLQLKLDAEKAEYDRKCNLLQQKEEDYRRRDLAFQQSLVKFEAFSKKNESMYLRSSKRLAEEIKLCEAKDEEAKTLLKLLEEKRLEERDLRDLIDKKKRYHDYLDSSASQLHLPSRCTDVVDIINHHELLKQSCEKAKQRRKEIETEISTHKNHLNQLHLLANANTNNATPENTKFDMVNLEIAYILECFERGRKLRDGTEAASSIHDPNTALEKIARFTKAYSKIVDEWADKVQE